MHVLTSDIRLFRRGGRFCGFTLVELLLVLVIIGILTAVTLPSFVKSIRGNRLRVSARTVVMMGKYAKTMALMKQVELALVFDISGSSVSVCSADLAPKESDVPAPMSSVTPEIASSLPGTDGTNTELSAQSPDMVQVGNTLMSRKLDGVRVEYVETQDGRKLTQGQCIITYRSNGTCTPYVAKILDERGSSVTVNVDALASATTEGSQ